MPTVIIWCIWLPCNAIHLPYDNTQLQYSAYSSHLMPHASQMIHMVHRDSKWQHTAHVAPILHIWLPYCICGSHRIPSTSHVAPYCSHMGKMAPLWLTLHSQGAHVAHAAPIWCTQLPYNAHGSHMAIIWHIWLPYGDICLPHGTSPHGTHIFYMGVTCCPDMVPGSSHMVYAAPIWCMQLPYGTCGSNMVPSNHVAIWGHPPPIVCPWLALGPPTVHVAPIWCMWLPGVICISQMAPSVCQMAPIMCMWLP
jgi:hypothetical protein